MRILLLLILLFNFFTSYSFAFVRQDSSRLNTVYLDENKLDSLKNLDEYNYSVNDLKIQNTIFDDIIQWINRLLTKIIITTFRNTWLQVLIVLLIVSLVVFLILRSNSEVSNIFSSSTNSSLKQNIIAEELTEINYLELIKKYSQNSNYHEAIRYSYKYLLFKLNESQIIKYKEEKTNFEYYYEIKDLQLRKDFLDLTNVFEHVYYGEFKIQRELYNEISIKFSSLFNQSNWANNDKK